MADNAGQNGQAQDDLQGTDATEDRADAAEAAESAPGTGGQASDGETAAEDGAPAADGVAESDAPDDGLEAAPAPDIVDRARKAAGTVADSARKAAGALGQETVSGWSAMRAVRDRKSVV